MLSVCWRGRSHGHRHGGGGSSAEQQGRGGSARPSVAMGRAQCTPTKPICPLPLPPVVEPMSHVLTLKGSCKGGGRGTRKLLRPAGQEAPAPGGGHAHTTGSQACLSLSPKAPVSPACQARGRRARC